MLLTALPILKLAQQIGEREGNGNPLLTPIPSPKTPQKIGVHLWQLEQQRQVAIEQQQLEVVRLQGRGGKGREFP